MIKDMISLHNLKTNPGSKHKPKRVGRGNASGKGTTAGRGTKGQKARTGGRNKLKMLGLRRILMSTPKLRGFKSMYDKPETVTLDMIENNFGSGATVSPRTLGKLGLVSGRNVKILSTGKLTKKIKIVECTLSDSAKEVIEKLGGEIFAKGE